MDLFEPYFTGFLLPLFELNSSCTSLGIRIKEFQNNNNIRSDFKNTDDFDGLSTDTIRDSNSGISDIVSDSVSDTTVSIYVPTTISVYTASISDVNVSRVSMLVLAKKSCCIESKQTDVINIKSSMPSHAFSEGIVSTHNQSIFSTGCRNPVHDPSIIFHHLLLKNVDILLLLGPTRPV